MARRYDPFERMNRLFEQTCRSMVDPGAFGMESWAGGEELETNATVKKTDVGYAVVADLPGFETEELEIRFDDSVLAIRVETETTEEREGIAGRRSRRIHEHVTIPGEVHEDEITASYRNGVLEVLLPAEVDDEDGGHRIEIN